MSQSITYTPSGMLAFNNSFNGYSVCTAGVLGVTSSIPSSAINVTLNDGYIKTNNSHFVSVSAIPAASLDLTQLSDGFVTNTNGTMTTVSSINMTNLSPSLQSNITTMQANITTLQANVTVMQANITVMQSNIAALQSQGGGSSITVDSSVPLIDAKATSSIVNFGKQWSSLTATPTSNYVGIGASSNGQYIIGCSWSGGMSLSNDYGLSWTTSYPIGGYVTHAAISLTGQYMAICSAWTGGQFALSKNFGATWSSASGSFGGVIANNISISESGKSWATVDNNGNVYTSNDYATTWTKMSAVSGSSLNSVCMTTDGSIIYVGGITGIYKITNGVSSLIYTNPASNSLSKMSCSGNGQYILASNNSSASDYLYLSTNGGTSFSQVATSKNWSGVSVSTSGQYMAACVSGEYIYTSVNYGTTWTVALTSASNGWQSIVMGGNGQFIYAISPWGYVYAYSTSVPTIQTTQISNPGKGSMYFDEATNRLYVYNSTSSAWKYITLA